MCDGYLSLVEQVTLLHSMIILHIIFFLKKKKTIFSICIELLLLWKNIYMYIHNLSSGNIIMVKSIVYHNLKSL